MKGFLSLCVLGCLLLSAVPAHAFSVLWNRPFFNDNVGYLVSIQPGFPQDIDGDGIADIITFSSAPNMANPQTSLLVARLVNALTGAIEFTYATESGFAAMPFQVVYFDGNTGNPQREVLYQFDSAPGQGLRTVVISGVNGVNPIVGAPDPAPAELRLGANAPNPFGGRTSIGFTVSRPGRAGVNIYDVTGRLVKTLVDEQMAAGEHTVSWDGLDSGGRQMASGAYFYELEVGGQKATRKMLMLR